MDGGLVPRRGSCTWLGVVGPDGSGKTAFASYLVDELRAQGLSVVHTHGRPQTLLRRTPPPRADPSAPQSGSARNVVLSLAKYLLAAADFLLSRRRFRSGVDIWVCERPLLDYEVDPVRYQLAPRALPLVRLFNRFLALPDLVAFLDGDAETMADRKAELASGEIQRQLAVWREIERRARVPFYRLNTTKGDGADKLAQQAAAMLTSTPRLRWRWAPVKPRRLDVRFAGHDLAALDIYRPIRPVVQAVDWGARQLVRARMTPAAPAPDPLVEGALQGLHADERFEGVAAMASSTPGRWVYGLAKDRRLQYVVKIGQHDDPGLEREILNLRWLEAQPIADLQVPSLWPVTVGDGRRTVATHVHEARLTPVTSVAEAIDVATLLAHAGWTHGDLAPWNLFTGSDGRYHLLDWEDARSELDPLADMIHYLLRLGATTHPTQARAALDQLTSGHPRFRSLLSTSGLTPSLSTVGIGRLISAYLDRTEHDVMSPRESDLRDLVRRAIPAAA